MKNKWLKLALKWSMQPQNQRKVVDAGKGNTPLEGVTVSISSTQTATTGSDGTFEIGNLPLADYTVTFTKAGYASIAKKVAIADFVDGIATIEVRMGGTEILRGLTLDDLKLQKMVL